MSIVDNGGDGGTPPTSARNVVCVPVGAVVLTGIPPQDTTPPSDDAPEQRRAAGVLHHGNGRGRDDDAQSVNPRPRRRNRTDVASASRCCQCHQSSGCTAAAQSNCACRRTNRVCTNCAPGCSRCTNRGMPSSDRAPTQRTMGSFFGSSSREPQATTTAAVPTAIPPPADRNVVNTPPLLLRRRMG